MVLGAERFRNTVRSTVVKTLVEDGAAPHTPGPRPCAGTPTTGSRPSPTRQPEGHGGGGFLSLSSRLRGAQLQRNLLEAAQEKDKSKPTNGSGQLAVEEKNCPTLAAASRPERSETGFAARSQAFGEALGRRASTQPQQAFGEFPLETQPGLSLAARSRAFGEALEKKARASQATRAGPLVAMEVDTQGNMGSQENGSFRPGQLATWMELAAQSAPPTRPGREGRVMAGGLQESYVRAIRNHLTEASLAAHANTVGRNGLSDGCPVTATELPAPTSATAAAGGAAEVSLLMEVVEAHEGPEGLLIFGTVLEASSASCGLDPGSTVRTLLHKRHAAVRQLGDAWAPHPGSRLRMRLRRNAALAATCGWGPLLVPLELLEEDHLEKHVSGAVEGIDSCH